MVIGHTFNSALFKLSKLSYTILVHNKPDYYKHYLSPLGLLNISHREVPESVN